MHRPEPLRAQHGKTHPVHQAIKVRLGQTHEIRSPAYTYGESVTEAALAEAFLKIYTEAAREG